jgi:hypothetical protein
VVDVATPPKKKKNNKFEKKLTHPNAIYLVNERDSLAV